MLKNDGKADVALQLIFICASFYAFLRIGKYSNEILVKWHTILALWIGWCALNVLLFLAREWFVAGKGERNKNRFTWKTTLALSIIYAAVGWFVY